MPMLLACHEVSGFVASPEEVQSQVMTNLMSSSQTTILVVDDEPSVRKLLRRCFETELYTVLETDCGEGLFAALNSTKVDLITLDLNLAGEDGLQIAREVRSQSRVPIIMVSGKNDLIDKVVGLEVGADDYVTKPFELREVLARVRSVLRRAPELNNPQPAVDAQGPPIDAAVKSPAGGSGCCYYFNGLALCTRTRELSAADQRQFELTTAEFDLLEVFARHAQQALSRDQIMNLMKGQDWNPNDRTIDNHVAQVRKTLAEAGSPTIIKTLRGIGYQFTAKVTVETDSDGV